MIKILKEYIKTKPRLYDILYSFRPIRSELGIWLDAFSKSSDNEIQFVQIGVNDGLRGDPIRRFIIRDQWSGIFVEPLPIVFKMLRKNYSHVKEQKLLFVNAAISSKDNECIDIWTCSEKFCNSLSLDDKLYYLRKSSLEKKYVEENLKGIDNPQDCVENFSVKCMTLQTLLDKYWKSYNIDLILIDTEGHDDVIIRSIDFLKIHPKVVVFESGHLSHNRKGKIFSYLSEMGYKVIDIRSDSIAVDTGILKSNSGKANLFLKDNA